jgi:hypothetical protein
VLIKSIQDPKLWLRRAPVAQLDSASVFGTEGCRFESYRACWVDAPTHFKIPIKLALSQVGRDFAFLDSLAPASFPVERPAYQGPLCLTLVLTGHFPRQLRLIGFEPDSPIILSFHALFAWGSGLNDDHACSIGSDGG